MFRLLMIFLLLLPQVYAASISGTVYDFSLEVVDDAVVMINTTPEQTIVAKNGKYSFDVGVGSYEIHVGRTTIAGIVEEETQYITVLDDGIYVLDFILFASLEEEEDLDFEENLLDEEDTGHSFASSALLILLLLGLGFFGYIKYTSKVVTVKITDDIEEEILSLIRKEVRINQKELRKHINYSEAKVSLVLSDLEKSGRIRKVKKGRGNILIFVK